MWSVVVAVVFVLLGTGAATVIMRRYPSDQGRVTDMVSGLFLAIVVAMMLFMTMNYVILLAKVT